MRLSLSAIASSSSRSVNCALILRIRGFRVETLRRTRNLSDALEAAQGGRTRLLNRLAQAQSSLRSALQDIDAFKDDEEVRQLVAECESAIESVKAVMDG
jgi:hypothetical protein